MSQTALARIGNPKTNPLLWLGAAVVVGGGIWYFTRKKKKEKKAEDKQPTAAYEGSERYPTAQNFGEGLLALEYPTAVGTVGWKIDDEQTKSQILQFQKDYTLVRNFAMNRYGLDFPEVETNGIADPATVEALGLSTDLIEANKEELGTWPEVVQQARLPPVPTPDPQS